ncbi:MAG: hypothetical protein Q8K32_13550 [Archangium sp.]|nr:hypothetical protein [Archangium sp.]
MTRISPTFFLAALAISCSGAGPDDSFYLRFDPLLAPDTPQFIGEFRVALFKDRIFSTGRTGTGEMLATSVRQMDPRDAPSARQPAALATPQGARRGRAGQNPLVEQQRREAERAADGLGSRR